MALQYYKLTQTGENYVVDTSTGNVSQVGQIPAGAPTVTWGGSNLPPALASSVPQPTGAPNPYAPSIPSQPSSLQGQGAGFTGGTPYFLGGNTLVKFSDGGDPYTVWYVDSTSKTLRPFSSDMAVMNSFSDPVQAQQALQRIQTISTRELGSGGTLAGFQPLGSEYAINEYGQGKPVNYSTGQISTRYNSAIDETLETNAHMVLDGFLSMVKGNGALGGAAVDGILNDPGSIAFYMNALAYGGYTLSDVYRDMKRKELISQGRTDLQNVQPISATQNRITYQNTNEGRAALSNSSLTPPQQIGNLPSSSLNLAIYDIPDEAFKTLVPVLDYNSDEFKQKMGDVQSAYHDILLEMLSASTEQEKAIADYNWNQFRSELERTYGIQLSNNAFDAWGQIENAYDSFSQRNIFNSGLQNEAIDDYLKQVRRKDENIRSEKKVQSDSKMMDYYTKYASSKQIQDLVAEDQAKGLPKDQWRAVQWGLVPSDDVKNALSFATLKTKYPNLSDDEINRYISGILDENGNYRSNLYQRYVGSQTDILDSKKEFQQNTVLQKALNDEQKAYKEFTTPEVPFLRADNSAGQGTPSTVSPVPAQQSFVNAAVPPTPSTPAPTTDLSSLSSMTAALQKAAAQLNALKAQQTPTTTKPVTSSSTPTYSAPVQSSPTPTKVTVPSGMSTVGSSTNQSRVPANQSPYIAPAPQSTYTAPKTNTSVLGSLFNSVKSWF